MQVNPDHDIKSLQNRILQKMISSRSLDAKEKLEQAHLDGQQLNVILFMLTMVHSYCIYIGNHINNFLIQNSLGTNHDMNLIYNGKCLCPNNALSDYYNSEFKSYNVGGSRKQQQQLQLQQELQQHHANQDCSRSRKRFSFHDSPTTMTIHASCPIKGGCFIVSFSILVTIVMAVCMSVCTCGLSLVVIPLLAPFLFILPLFCL